MESKKYCPLFTLAAALIKVESAQHCMEENCAWYQNMGHQCLFVEAANNLLSIAAAIDSHK